MFAPLKSVIYITNTIQNFINITCQVPDPRTQSLGNRIWDVQKGFVINLYKRWVWNNSFIQGRQHMSLLYFTVCEFLETWLYICLCAREFLCKCACLRLLRLFLQLFVDNVWIQLNLGIAKWHPVSIESYLCASMWEKYTDMGAYEDHSLHTSAIRGQYSLFCTQLFDSASSTGESFYSSDPLLQLLSQVTHTLQLFSMS